MSKQFHAAVGMVFGFLLGLTYLAFWAMSGAGFVGFVLFHALIIMIALLSKGQWRAGLGVLGGAFAVLFLSVLAPDFLEILSVCCVLLFCIGFIRGMDGKGWWLCIRALAVLLLLNSFFENREAFYLVLLIWCAVECLPSLATLSKKAWAKMKLRESWRRHKATWRPMVDE